MNKTTVKLETSPYSQVIQTNANNAGIYLDRRELKDELSRIHEDKIIKHDETNSLVQNDITYKEKEPTVTAENVIAKTKRVRKSKRNNQLVDDKKENLKKVNSVKTVKQKASIKKSDKTSSKLLDMNKFLKQKAKELAENVELYKINSEECLKCSLLPFTALKPETKHDAKFLYPHVMRQQELNQYGSENNTNVLQHLDYNNLKYMNQQAVPVTNSWVTAPKSNENFVLNNNTSSEAGQNSYINDKHHAYSAAIDYSWKQNENPYFNSFTNSADPYKLLSENKAYCRCSIYGPNYIWNNMCMENFPRTNATFQQAVNNVASNYVPPANSSTNFLNPPTTPFNPFYYRQPLLTDDNFRKLYYMNQNSSRCELPMKKENVAPLLDNWHHASSLLIPSNSNLNVPPTIPTWYNTPPLSSLDASTSAISNTSKVPLKCEQSTYFGNYNADMTKVSVHKDQWREKDYFVPYVKPALENTLPMTDTHGSDPYKADNELLTNIFTQQNTEYRSTTTNTDNSMASDLANHSSEMNVVDVPEDLHTSSIYSKDTSKTLIAKVLESIL